MQDYLSTNPHPIPSPIDRPQLADAGRQSSMPSARCHASGATRHSGTAGRGRHQPRPHRDLERRAAAEANKVVREMGIERAGLVEAPLTGSYGGLSRRHLAARALSHNGSVPTLRDLLEAPESRPTSFRRGYNVYDPAYRVGFVTSGRMPSVSAACTTPRRRAPATVTNSAPHCPTVTREALVEYLKTLCSPVAEPGPHALRRTAP